VHSRVMGAAGLSQFEDGRSIARCAENLLRRTAQAGTIAQSGVDRSNHACLFALWRLGLVESQNGPFLKQGRTRKRALDQNGRFEIQDAFVRRRSSSAFSRALAMSEGVQLLQMPLREESPLSLPQLPARPRTPPNPAAKARVSFLKAWESNRVSGNRIKPGL